MPRYSRKDYVLIAKHISSVRNLDHNHQEDANWALDILCEKLAVDFKVDNPNFDIDKFMEAAGHKVG